MSTYQQLQQKALGIAFILGIERSPDGTSSWVEGIFMAMAFALMVPVNLELSRVLGQGAPRLGIYCAATTVGLAFGIQSIRLNKSHG